MKKLMIAGLMTLTAMAGANAGADESEVGRNSAVKGIVGIKSANTEVERQAVVKEPVFLGDEVNSKIGASLQVLLKDNSTFTVGPQCSMVIDKFVYDPKKNNNSMSAKVKRGMFRFTSGKVSKTNPDNITVETPTATMGIRGTMVEVLVGPEAFLCAEKEGLLAPDIPMDHAGATLVILRGPGENTTSTSRPGVVDVRSAGQTVTLTESGTGVLVTNADQKPSEPFLVSESLFNFFNRRLRTQPSGEDNFRPFEVDDRLFTPIPEEEEEEETSFIAPLDAIEEDDWPSSQGIDDIDLQNPGSGPF